MKAPTSPTSVRALPAQLHPGAVSRSKTTPASPDRQLCHQATRTSVRDRKLPSRLQKTQRSFQLPRTVSAPRTAPDAKDAQALIERFCQPFSNEQLTSVSNLAVESDRNTSQVQDAQAGKGSSLRQEPGLDTQLRTFVRQVAFLRACRDQAMVVNRTPVRSASGFTWETKRVLDETELPELIDAARDTLKALDKLIDAFRQQRVNAGVLVQAREQMARDLMALQ